MTTARAGADRANDPYVLPMPRPDGPVVLAKWISPANTQPNSLYRDPVWSMGPLIDNPASSLDRVLWKNCPPPLRDQLKLIAWTMINGQLRPTYLHGRGVQARARTSADDMYATCNESMRLARWLHQRRIDDLGACTADLWRAHLAERLDGIARTTAALVCGRLTDLWAFDGLSAAPTGIAQPPWDTEGLDDFLPAADRGRGENATEPLDPQVLGPLLVWATRFVDDFSDDILAASAERDRLVDRAAANRGTPATWTALERYLLPMVHDGQALPAGAGANKMFLSLQYVAALTGASTSQVQRFAAQHDLAPVVERTPGPCPLPTPARATLDGRPWREAVDFHEVPQLMRHLGTAAAMVCLYLTGMRPQEVQNLRSGCCPDPQPIGDGAPGRHLIRSHGGPTADPPPFAALRSAGACRSCRQSSSWNWGRSWVRGGHSRRRGPAVDPGP